MGAESGPSTRADKLATVIEEPKVTALLESVEDKYPRIWDAFDGLTWQIANAPQDGWPLDGNHIYARTLEGARSIKVPTLTAIYLVESDDLIQVIELRIYEAEHGYLVATSAV